MVPLSFRTPQWTLSLLVAAAVKDVVLQLPICSWSAFSWACGSDSAAEGERAVAAEGSLHIQAASTAVGPQLSPIIFREEGRGAGSELQAGSQSTKKIINLLICMSF